MKLLSAKDLMQFGWEKLRVFAHHYAIYQFPTIELLELLKNVIGDDLDNCIEIGAGRGDVGRLLGVKMTDSKQQDKKQYQEMYAKIKQPTIIYPSDVKGLNYKEAIKKHRPKTVLGCWVTHKYDPKHHSAGGNIEGIESDYIIKRAKFVFVGNLETHKNWRIPEMCQYKTYFNEGIISRAANHAANFVAVFTKLKRNAVQ